MSFLKDLGWSVVLRQCRSSFPDAPTMSTDELERNLESNGKDVLILDVRKKEEVQRTNDQIMNWTKRQCLRTNIFLFGLCI